MGGLLSSKRDGLETPHEMTSVVKEMESQVQTRKYSVKEPKEPKEPSVFSRHIGIEATSKVSTKTSMHYYEALKFRSSRSRHWSDMDEYLIEREEDFDYSSLNRIPIKLSAKQLIESNLRGSGQLYDYLTDRFSKECSKSLTLKRYSASDPIYLDLHVDLSELECEKSSKNIQRIHSSRDYSYQDDIIHTCIEEPFEDKYQVSLVVTQTAQKSVSRWAIMQVKQTFIDLNLFSNKQYMRLTKMVLESVDISGCTVPTQVLLLPEILSSYHQHTERHNRFLENLFGLKIICFFSEDLYHLKEDEFAQLIEMSKVMNRDITKEQLQRLIECICNIHQEGKIPLALAANNEKLTHALIEAGTDVNQTDKDGKTALFYAGDNERITHALIKAGADIKKTDKNGKTALFYAGYNEKVTHALIKAGADIKKTDKDGKTALFYAGNNDKFAHALIEAGADVNITGKDGKTALFYAGDNEKVTRALIKAGADVNITDNDGKTALFYSGDNEKVTHALTEASADVNITGKDGKTALFYAGDNENVAHALIKAGAGVNITDKDGKTALFYAGDNEKVAHTLIEAGADANKTGKDGKTALFYAGDNEKVTHALIEAGSDVNQTDKDGKTALFYAVYNIGATQALIEAGAEVNISDKDGKTAFLHVFDTKPSNIHRYNPSAQICKCLLENGSSLCETSKKEETAFHLIFKHFQRAIISTIGENEKKLILQELMSILELFSELRKSKVAVNKRDIHLNSPLHLWASLELTSSRHYSASIFDNQRFEDVLKHILNLLVKCGVKLNDSNEKGEKPLHVCRTWTAVKLLLDAGANPSVTDSSGRTPLLAAAMNNTCLKKGSNNFYPDMPNPAVFWKYAFDKKLDPWSADKNGQSIFSVTLSSHFAAFSVEVACEQNYIKSDEAGITILASLCKSSINRFRTIYLVKKLLMSRRSLAQGRLSNQDTVLHLICRNILELPEKSVKSSVHWEIVQYLILCGADVETPGVDGKSCLDLAEKCPVLKDLLSNPVSSEEVRPLIVTWERTSQKHEEKLAKAARGSNCQQMESVFYFNQALDNGSFGLVFVGIYTHNGKEVAVKRVEIMRIDQEKVRKEIKDLKATIDCDKVIQCLLCTEDKDFLYVVLELMEGNLADLLSNEGTFDCHQKIKLCRDIITGLEYLHRNNITHRGIKPSNILYQGLPPAIKLKLAFFGLRCQMSEQCTSDFTDTYETLAKARCWMAPEVLQSQSHSQSSDVFSCGLVIHYLLSGKKHPFAPVGSREETSLAVSIETVVNITRNKIELDGTISSDAKDLLKGMLDQDTSHRPKISQALAHRFFHRI